MQMNLLEQLPELPYAGTSGFSGTDTSETRARTADKSGETKNRQYRTLKMLRLRGADGLTWKELAEATGYHHGTASGVLSALHKAGHIARLRSSRNGCKVYCDLNWVNGRPVESQGRKRSCPHCGGVL